MDFIVGLPRTQKGYNSIWVVVDRLTKVAHFIPVNTTYSGARLTKLYISRIVCLHSILKKIITDRGSQFGLGVTYLRGKRGGKLLWPSRYEAWSVLCACTPSRLAPWLLIQNP
jgi:hypothetical protein